MLKVSTKRIKIAQNFLNVISLENDNIQLELLDIGATVYSLRTRDNNGKFENIILQYADIENYFNNPSYYGASIGRVAGRIKDGEFILNNKKYSVSKNEKSINTLHGGFNNISHQIFDYRVNQNKVKFSRIQKSSDDGFPADVQIDITYELQDNSLVIDFEAIANEDTLLNLTNHNYYNLSGDFKATIENHKLQASAEKVVITDTNSIPKQIIKIPYEMDFSQESVIADKLETNFEYFSGGGIDHCYIVDGAIKLTDEISGRKLVVTSSYPATQIYTTNFPDGLKLSNSLNSQKFHAICFEPQFIPVIGEDYDNSDIKLKKEQQYKQFIKLEF
ncbi:aldose epimerase family protein [Francisella philomiragia]|uniref:aldose epimerase family protein n=1 Tax=Francisella philomiragia TaxID=28110 RepID=UPI00190849FA|nr:aldose epimerase family protein [Francisella philomiragia]MBK2295643.1 galactose mutarotase [Francisella philomiragia]MBK2340473.1 galactose mutarotase [Francisella philomiragia]